MPSGKNAWLIFLIFDLLMNIVILHALHSCCFNGKHSSSIIESCLLFAMSYIRDSTVFPLQLVTQKRVFHLMALRDVERTEWIQTIRRAAQLNNPSPGPNRAAVN